MARRDDDDRRHDDDDDDDRDRPRRRRRRDDDDDEGNYDDRPRPKKSGSSVGIILGVLFGLFLLCGIGGVALMLPAISKVRQAAARNQNQNNMKMLGLGMHNFNDTMNGMPGPFAVDEKGQVKQGLSFRVSLLPYIEQDATYRQFDLNQPWNNARNTTAANTIIKQYNFPGDPPSTQTPYRIFHGGGAMFETDGKMVKITSITDGTSNTIMMIEATDTVNWAEPKELPYSATTPLPPLGHKGAPTYSALFADGSVRTIQKTLSEATLRLLITKADGMVIPPGDW
ncbi:MAG: DUF1559 domain-containing protein [Gemmataceae bacterium]